MRHECFCAPRVGKAEMFKSPSLATVKDSTFMKDSVHQRTCVFAQLYPTLGDPMDCSLSGSSVHGIMSARILELFAISSSSRESSRPPGIEPACPASPALRRFFYHLSQLGSPISLIDSCNSLQIGFSSPVSAPSISP